MLSVNTNAGAMVALQYLNSTASSMNTVQNAISTGMKVANAKDNGAIYAIAQNMRGDVAGYQAVTDSLNRGISTIDVALSAGQSISDLLIQMKQKALAASDSSLDTASRQALNSDFTRSARPDHVDRQQRRVQRLQPDRRFDQPGHGPGVRGRFAPHHRQRPGHVAVRLDRHAEVDRRHLDRGQGLDDGRHDRQPR